MRKVFWLIIFTLTLLFPSLVFAQASQNQNVVLPSTEVVKM
ncbi:MAG: hypothetical protein Q7S44_04440 [bacterium]|nr:hypothetical protein [bacterium]